MDPSEQLGISLELVCPQAQVFSSASFLDDLIEFHGFPKQLYAEHSQIKFQPILFHLSSTFSVTLHCPRNALLLIIFKRELNGNPSHNNFSTSVNAFTTQSATQVKISSGRLQIPLFLQNFCTIAHHILLVTPATCRCHSTIS